MGGDHIDDLWASLQAEDNAARKTKRKAVRKGNRATEKTEPTPAIRADADKSTTLPTSPEQLPFHIRSVMNGDLGQRKTSLKVIAEVCGQHGDGAVAVWEELRPVLLDSLSDQNSACREAAALALTRLCSTDLFKAADNIRAVADILLMRFSPEEVRGKVMFGSAQSDASDKKVQGEDIEEVRVVLVGLLQEMLTAASSGLLAAVDILVPTIAAACRDPAPEVKRSGCSCASLLASKSGEGIEEKLWEDLLAGVASGNQSALGHQHAKVREAAVKALGTLLPIAPASMWEKILPKVKGVHQDRHAKVRLSLIRIILDWLLAGCAAQHRSGLLVQLLMAEADEVPEVSQFAEGAIASAASHFNPEAAGPLDAIEALLGAHLAEIVPEVVDDVVEWRSSTRLKAAQTLVVVVKYAANCCADHLDAFLPALFKGCRDDDDEVAKFIFEASEAIGEVVTPDHFIKRIMQHATSGKYEAIQRVSHLQVLACMLATAEPEEVIDALPILFDGLRSPVLNQEAGILVHQQIVDCVASVIDNCEGQCNPEATGLVEVLTTMRALNLTDESFCAEVDETGGRLATVLGLPSLAALHGICAAPRLQQLLGWADVEHLTPSDVPWNKDSHELSQLETILLLADAPALVSHLDLLLRAIVACSDNSHEPELRLRVVHMLAALMTEAPISRALRGHFEILVYSIIKPCGKWFSGRMIERLRESAMALLCLVMRNKVGTANEFAESEEEILMTIRANIDDDWVPELRRCSTETLGEYIVRRAEGGRLDGKAAEAMTEDLMKRMDDKLDQVRMQACTSLGQLFEYIPGDYGEEAWTKSLDTLMIHLDDPNEEIRQGVQNILCIIAKRKPAQLLERCEKACPLHQTSRHCAYLMEQCRMHQHMRS